MRLLPCSPWLLLPLLSLPSSAFGFSASHQGGNTFTFSWDAKDFAILDEAALASPHIVSNATRNNAGCGSCRLDADGLLITIGGTGKPSFFEVCAPFRTVRDAADGVKGRVGQFLEFARANAQVGYGFHTRIESHSADPNNPIMTENIFSDIGGIPRSISPFNQDFPKKEVGLIHRILRHQQICSRWTLHPTPSGTFGSGPKEVTLRRVSLTVDRD